MKTLIVFGTRPEIIKLAPVYFKLKDKIETKILHTRQHDELADDVLNFFGIEPDYNERTMLVMAEERRLGNIRTIIKAENPDIVIVQGDTFTTYAGAYTSFLLKKPVLHLEAGLRTFKKFSPYPEEIFRKLTTQLSEFHFAPTIKSKNNLLSEGIPENRIFVTGNPIVDATNMTLKLVMEKDVQRELEAKDPAVSKMIETKKFFLITSHRRENIGKPLKKICQASLKLAKKYPDKIFLWLLHKNPQVREIVFDSLQNRPQNLRLLEALTYPTLLYLINRAQFVLTDSGGIQEEIISFKKPVIILRNDTERPEVVEAGLGFLVGSNERKIIDTFITLNEDEEFYNNLDKIANPFGDGKTAERVVNFLQKKQIREFLKKYPKSYNDKIKVKNLL